MNPSYKTDLSMIPVIMQGSQPCCAEAAITAMVEFYFYLKTGVYTPLSFRFLAALTAAKDGVAYAQSGTSPMVAFSILVETGICTAATYPNDITLTDAQFIDLSQIPAAAYTEAANYKIPGFQMLTDLRWESINAAIAKYQLVMTSLYLDKDWYLSSVPNSNPLPLPPPTGNTDPSLSRHATVSFGYDPSFRYVRNSFGTTFGQNGDGYYGPDYQPWIFAAGYIPDMETVQATAILDKVEHSTTIPAAQTVLQEVVETVEKALGE
jgi:hypothetical protein